MVEFPAGLRFPQDIIDIVLVAFVIYRILLLIKGTRAFQILVGMMVIAGAYAGGQFLELFTLNWILNAFLSSFIVVSSRDVLVSRSTAYRRTTVTSHCCPGFTSRPGTLPR